MNVGFNNFKRCVSMLLVVAMLISVSNLSMVLPVAAENVDGEYYLGDVMADNYSNLSGGEKAILSSGGLSVDVSFKYTTPPEEANDENKLVVVDEDSKTVTVKVFEDEEGNEWIPASFDIQVNGEAAEGNGNIALTENGGAYSGSYTYAENMFSVVVTYVLDTDHLTTEITADQQLDLLNAAGKLGADIEYVQKLTDDKSVTMEYGTYSMAMTPVQLLVMLTDTDLPIGQLDGGSVIDFLYNLFVTEGGVEEIVTLPDGTPLPVELKLGLGAKLKLTSLYNQQNGEGIALDVLFNEHADLSELEIAAKHTEELEEALDANYDEISSMLKGLEAVGGDLDAYIEMVDSVDPYESINEALAEYNDQFAAIGIVVEEVNSVEDLEALRAEVNEVYELAVDEAEYVLEIYGEKLAAVGITVPETVNSTTLAQLSADISVKYNEALAQINAQIAENAVLIGSLGITVGEVENSEDVGALAIAIDDAMADVISGIDAAVSESGYSDAVVAAGGPSRIESKEDVASLAATLGKIKEDSIAQINAQLAANAAALAMLGITTTSVANADDLANIISTAKAHPLASMAAAQIGTLEQLHAGLVALDGMIANANNAYTMLVAGESVVDQLYDAQDVLELAEDSMSETKEASEALAVAEDVIATIDGVIAQLNEVEAMVNELNQMNLVLDMLVDVLNQFCTAVKPVVERCDNNEWNAGTLLNDDADYAAITDAAEGITTTYTVDDVKENLTVATSKTQYNMSMYNVTVKVNASVVENVVDSDKLVALTENSAVVTLRKGAAADEILPYINNVVETALNGWAVIDDNYDKVTSDINALLTEGALVSDITYEVNYAPKSITVTLGDGFEENSKVVPYGYQMTLEKNAEEGMAYSYTVDGEKVNQGTVITITAPVEISRTAGTADQIKTVVDLIVNTDIAADVESFIQSPALNQGSTFWLVAPEDSSLVDQSELFTEGTVTAASVDSELGGLVWVPVSAATYDDNGNEIETVFFIDNKATVTNTSYANIKVVYELDITTEALAEVNVTADEILAKMNLRDTLAKDYAAQKAALEQLLTQRGRLAQISENRGAINTATQLQGVKPESVAAIKAILAQLDEVEAETGTENLKIYYLLSLCDTDLDGKVDTMVPYYQRSAEYITEVVSMLGLVTVIENDPVLKKALEDNGKLELFTELKAQFSALELPAVHEDIDTSNETTLTNLLNNIESSVGSTVVYDSSALADMTWTAEVSAAGVGSVEIPITLTVNGITVSDTISLKVGSVVTDANMTAVANKLAALEEKYAAVNGAIDKVHNTSEETFLTLGDTIDGTEAVTVVWTHKTYTVDVVGNVTTITYNNATVTLPGTNDTDISYVYSYTYGGNTVSQTVSVKDQTYTFPKADFDAIFANGTVTVTRETINVAEAELIALFDAMKGAAVLEKNADGKYAAVLPIVPTAEGAKAGLANFAMALFMSNYAYIGMDGETLYGPVEGTETSQYFLQTIVDAIMNSGTGTQAFMDAIDENGNVVNMTLDGYEVIGAYDVDNLGGKLVKTTMSFGSSAEKNITVDFYITLADTNDMVLNVNKALEDAKNYVSVTCENGMMNAVVTLPDQVYAVYVAALSAVGEADLDNIDALNNQVALSYLLTILDPILSGEVTAENIENTIAKFGKDVAFAGTNYEKIYNTLVKYYNGAKFENDLCIIPVENIVINGVIARLQSMVDEMAASYGLEAGSINLSTIINEYKDGEDAEGLNVTLSAKLTNVDEDYAAIVVDVKAATKDKVHIYTSEELVAAVPNLAGASAIILLDDVNGDLVFNTKTLLDLNGKNVNGSITANNTVVITDSTVNNASSGTVSGTVSGSATVVGGKYEFDVSANLKDGYAQDENGLVYNKFYTLALEENELTVTLNATPSDVKEFLNKASVIAVAADLVVDVLVNNYDVAALSVDGYMIYDINVEDIIGIATGTNRVDIAIDTVLDCISAPELAELFDAVVADLTDFAALETALNGDGLVASYTATTAPWVFELDVTEDEYLTVNLVSGETTTDYTINVVVNGTYQDDLAVLAGAMADTVVVESDLTLEDIYRSDNDEIVVNGAYTGSVDMDFTSDPNYVIMMAVVMAANSDDALRAELVEAVESYYVTHSLKTLEDVFDSITAAEICDGLANVARGEKFTAMAESLGLSADAEAAVIAIGDDEMGYVLAIEFMGYVLRQLDSRELLEKYTESGRTLGSFKKTDAEGNEYYGFSGGKTFTGAKDIYSSYSVAYNLDVTEISVGVRLFAEEKAIVVEDADGKLVERYDDLSDAFSAAADNYTVIVVEAVTETDDIKVAGIVNLEGAANVTFDSCGIILTAEGATVAADADIEANVSCADGLCLSVDGYTYTAVAHNYVKGDWKWTDYSSATLTFVCDNCGDEAVVNAEITGEVTVEKNCMTDEVTTYTATVVFEGETYTDTKDAVTAEAAGHGETELVNAKEATCTEDGYTGDKVCTICGETVEEGTVIPAVGHGETELVNAKNATCSEEGYTGDKICTICGETVETGTAIPKVPHGETKLVDAKDATCSEEGYTGDKVCTVCGETVETGTVIPATGHVETELVGAKDATCTEDGYTGDKICTACGETVVEGVVIPATGHGETELVGAKDATCTEDGYTGDKVCTVCGETVEAGEVIPATGHSYTAEFEWAEDYSTCKVTLTCGNCGDVIIVDADVTFETTNATCDSDGKTVYTATYGEYTDTKEVTIPATGHSYDFENGTWEWNTESDPVSATYTIVCDNCGGEKVLEAEVTSVTDGDKVIYTATVEFEGARKIDTKTVVLYPVLGTPALSSSDKVYAWSVKDNILYIDAAAEGIKVEELAELLKATAVQNDADSVTEVEFNNYVVSGDGNLVPTGATVTLTAENSAGVKVSATYSIVVIGDVNCDGRITNNDALYMQAHYLGTKEITNALALDAADTNRDERLTNNDALMNVIKYVDPENYESKLS